MRWNRRQVLSIGGAGVAVAAAVTAALVLGHPATSHPAQQPSLATASSSSSSTAPVTDSVAPTSSVAVTTTAPPPVTTVPATSTHKAVTHAVAQATTTTDGGSDPIVTGTNSYGVPYSKSVLPPPPAMCNVAPVGQPASLVPCPTS